MPSEKILQEKKATVVALAEKLKNATAGVFVDYKGLSVQDDTAMRHELRKAGVEYSVIKNTLARFALKEAGLNGFDEILNGTTALAISNGDVVAPAKILCNFAKDLRRIFEKISEIRNLLLLFARPYIIYHGRF